MVDDRGTRGARDRATVSGSETYEVDYFAKKHRISRKEAQDLIDRVGNGREALEAAVAARPRRTGMRVKAGVAAAAATGSAKRKPAGSGVRRKRATTSSRGLADTASDVAAPLTAAVEAVGRPALETITPLARGAIATPRKLKAAARRGAASVGKVVSGPPKAASRQIARANDAMKATMGTRAASLVGAAAAGLVAGLAVNLGRKMVVQAPSALAGDWLDALKVEHRLALALFDRMQATGNNEKAKRTVLLTQLKHALGKHAFTEENVIYPALRAWGDKADADKLNHDHGYVKQYLYDLEQMDNASPAYLLKVADLRSQLEAHIREEEDAIFPPLHAALGEAGNAKVTAMANKEGFKLA